MKRHRLILFTLAALAATGLGCLISIPEVEPANVAGSYRLTITNGPDGCGLFDGNWTPGPAGEATLDLWQEGSKVTGQVTGFVAALIAIGLGQTQFRGTIEGRAVRVTLVGTARAMRRERCSYSTNLITTATAGEGTLMNGRIVWQPISSGIDCEELETCETYQTFTGLRVGDAPPPPTMMDAGR